jgi:hypothetical protein
MQSDNVASWILILTLSFGCLKLIQNGFMVAGILLAFVITFLIIEQVMTLIERKYFWL